MILFIERMDGRDLEFENPMVLIKILTSPGIYKEFQLWKYRVIARPFNDWSRKENKRGKEKIKGNDKENGGYSVFFNSPLPNLSSFHFPESIENPEFFFPHKHREASSYPLLRQEENRIRGSNSRLY